MSYDLEVWSVDPFDFSNGFTNQDDWNDEKNYLEYSSKNWRIVIHKSEKVEPEDISEEISSTLPGINFLTRLHLEPIGAPQSVKLKAIKIAKEIGRLTHGIIENQQTNEIITPSGVKRYIPTKKDELFSILEMSFWSNENILFEERGVETLVELSQSTIPEALPKRYGIWEPPKYKLADKGINHLMSFLKENIFSGVVLYPHRPVIGLHIDPDKKWGPQKRGYCANKFSITFELDVLKQSGWEAEIKTFWKKLSFILKPFYGDVRILNGMIKSGGTYCTNSHSDSHPIWGPWWKGMPETLGMAAVISEPYSSLWKSFLAKSEFQDGMYFLSTVNWLENEEVSEVISGIPEDLMQKWKPRKMGGDKNVSYIHWESEPSIIFPFKTFQT